MLAMIIGEQIQSGVIAGAELTRRVGQLQNLAETVTAVLADTDAMQSAAQECAELLRIVSFRIILISYLISFHFLG